MANCKNCTHSNSVCKFENEEICKGTKVKDVEHECRDFKDKEMFVELPCKIGDVIYCISSHYTKCHLEYTPDTSDDYGCQGCEDECDSKREYYISEETNVSLQWIFKNWELFGKTIFTTFKEAEKTLEELNDNIL